MKTTDWGKGCTETSDECTLHNLHCGYPNCHKGKRDKKSKEETVTLPKLPEHLEYVPMTKKGYYSSGGKIKYEPCPDCGADLICGPSYSGVVCSKKCGYWFCY